MARVVRVGFRIAKPSWAVVAAALLLASCDSPTLLPSDPAAVPARPAGPAEQFRLTGQVLSLQARQPIGGAKVELIGFSNSSFATDAAGGFAIDAGAGSLIYTLNAPGFLQRRSALVVSGPRQGVALDMISLGAPFSLDFYRELVRDSLEHPSGGYSPTHPWPYDPKFYIRTVTEDSGEVVSDAIVNGVRRVLEASVPELSGGRLKVAEIRSGTEPMPRTVGWVQVSWGRDIGAGLGG